MSANRNYMCAPDSEFQYFGRPLTSRPSGGGPQSLHLELPGATIDPRPRV